MTRLRLACFLLLCSCGPAPVLLAQPTNDGVLARAELARKTITIGDQIFLEVNLSAPPGAEIAPLPEEFINAQPGLEVIRATALNTVAEEPELLLQQRFLITSFDTGYVRVPPLPYAYRLAGGAADTTYTADLLLRVEAIPGVEEAELRPIRPILAERRNWRDFWPLYLVLAAAALGFGLYRYRRGLAKPPPPPPPPPPADQAALAALDELEARRLWQQGHTKAYYTELTAILRGYLDGRFGIRAQEMTTRQITDELGRRAELDGEQRGELGQLLQISDLVKFARATPAEELHPRGLARVRAFVQDTSPATAAAATVAGPEKPTA